MIEFIKLIKNIISHDLFEKHKWVYFKNIVHSEVADDYNLRRCEFCNECQVKETIYEKWKTISTREFKNQLTVSDRENYYED
jgi:hypothetical protein